MVTKSVRSVDRAIDIILAFIDSPVMGIGELQQRLELPRPTLYRMLAALEQKGLIEWFGDPRRYRLGPKVLALSSAWQNSFNIVEIALPAIEQLHKVCDETIMLFVAHGRDNRMLVHQLKSTKPLSYNREIGYLAPLTVGAAGKVMLAFGGEAQIQNAVASTPEVERRKLLSDIKLIRNERYFAATGEVLTGALSLAAPIFGYQAEVIGAISIVGPEMRMNASVRAKLIPELISATLQVSRSAGYAGA
ncbi:MAG: IclR family transcriptional regulator [Pseudomonadota bacterium]